MSMRERKKTVSAYHEFVRKGKVGLMKIETATPSQFPDLPEPWRIASVIIAQTPDDRV